MATDRQLPIVVTALLTGLAGVVPPALAGQQADVARGAAVLAEARTALGGADRLAAIVRLQATGTTRRALGNLTIDGDTEVLIELPGRFRRNESLNIGAGGPSLERTEVLDGDAFWTETSGADIAGRGRGRFGGALAGGAFGGAVPDQSQVDPERLRAAQRANLQSEVSRLLLALLLTSDPAVAWVGTAQAPDGSADVLEVKTPDGVATRLFIDSATRMPLMLSWTGGGGRGGGFGGRAGGRGGAGRGGARGENPPEPADGAQGRRGRGAGAQGTPVTLEMHLAEYKTVSGVKLPHLITRGAGGETNEEWVVRNYRINPTFRANTFTR